MSTVVDLWLVRHAESIGNVDGTDSDTELSTRGCQQARQLAAALETVAFDVVWASPMSRARQTATLALPGVSPIADDRLAEFRPGPPVQFIDTSSLDFSEPRALVSAPEYGPMETGKEFMARVKTWWAELPSAGRVIAFTHFGVVREIIAGVVGFREAPQNIPHASVYRLDLGAAAPRAVLWWEVASTNERGDST